MTQKTILNELHREAGAKMVDFGGWDMPLHYGSQIEEHHHVRKSCGIFDVSHMTVVDVSGPDAQPFLSTLLANDVARLKGYDEALYTCMLNETGGVIDDLIVYWRSEKSFRLVVNASTRDKDIAWINKLASKFDVEINERTDYAMLAVQGPESAAVFAKVAANHNLSSLWEKVQPLKRFHAAQHNKIYVGRTGYTGEDGYEIMMPEAYAADTWRAFVGQGAKPCGLAARDTLRIEAGMNLYGTDMDEDVSPLEAGLAWTVSMAAEPRDFIGREALEAQQKTGDYKVLRGILLEGKGVIRGGYEVTFSNGQKSIVTSGTFSPTLARSVGFVPAPQVDTDTCSVDIRGRAVEARLCKLPFVRNGTIRIDL